jgi:hypothetical protein
MTNTNDTGEKKCADAGIKFPCGNFETMLKAIKEHKDKNGGKFDCSAMMKKFSEGADGKSGCEAMMQKFCSGKEGPIDCKAVMKELFGNMKTNTEASK